MDNSKNSARYLQNLTALSLLTTLVAIFANALPAHSQGEADFLKKILQTTALSPAEKASNDASQAFQKGSFEEALRLQQKRLPT